MNARQTKIQEIMQYCVGKTIKSVDATSVNCMTILFSDGTGLRLETECVLPSLNLPQVDWVADQKCYAPNSEQQHDFNADGRCTKCGGTDPTYPAAGMIEDIYAKRTIR